MNLDEFLCAGKRKRGPKPRPKSELAKSHNHSFPAEISRFLHSLDYPGAFLKSLIVNSDEYKKFKQ